MILLSQKPIQLDSQFLLMHGVCLTENRKIPEVLFDPFLASSFLQVILAENFGNKTSMAVLATS